MHWRVVLFALSLAVAGAGLSAAGEKPVSKFTSTAKKDAIKFHTFKDDPSGFEGLFRGFGDYQLEFVGGDERSWINVRYGKESIDLRDQTMDLGAGIGFFPHKANDAVEWRGTERDGHFIPYAVIYRIVGLDENGRRNKTRLVVIGLDRRRSRIVGHADEPKAEAQAEQIADRLRATN